MDKIVNIGQSIHIKGELTGNEDLTIEGKVEGKVFLKDHNLTVGANGKIVAEIQAKTVMVLGEVTGNITADDKVEVAATGSMRGDIQAPRVVLADGAKFKGAIDMDKKVGSSTLTSASTLALRPVMEPVGVGGPSKGANF
jgi:cytoskeletal protein CcmA (bactofilin family)